MTLKPSSAPVRASLALLCACACAASTPAQEAPPLPRNPYHGQVPPPDPEPAPLEGAGLISAPRLPDHRFDRQEFPEGPYGARVVTVTVSAQDLAKVEIPLLVQVRREVDELMRSFDWVQGELRLATQRLAWIAPLRHDSKEQYEAYVDLVDWINDLEIDAAALRPRLDEMQAYQEYLARFLATAPATTVVFRFRKPDRGTYVPERYLRDKALRVVAESPERIGETIRIEM